MCPGHDLAVRDERQSGFVELSNAFWKSRCQWHSEHLIKIAIREISLPVDRQHRAAHQTINRRRIKCLCQLVHIGIELAALQQIIEKATNRQVRNRKQLGEFNAVACSEFTSVISLELLLIRRQRGADRVVHQSQL